MSSLHSKLAASLARNPKLVAEDRAGSAGPVSIVVPGATVSTVQARDAAPPTLPARSVARTSKVCAPSRKPVSSCGLPQPVQAPSSSLHSNVAASSARNSKLAAAELLRSRGPAWIDVPGVTVSPVQLRVAGSASPFPAASVARTLKVCEPSAKPAYAWPLVHAAQSPASSRHSKVAVSPALNSNCAAALLVGSAGPLSMDVSGATVSSVQLWD